LLVRASWIPAPVESARILAVETVEDKSHLHFMSAILRALVDNRHNVTVFTPFTDGNRENYTEVPISTEAMVILDGELGDFMYKYGDPIKIIDKVAKMSRHFWDVIVLFIKIIKS